MLVKDIKEEHLSGYTHTITTDLTKRIEYINQIMSDLYAGRTLFQYNINEEVMKETLKNQYNIDG